jgi:hypothetical protein
MYAKKVENTSCFKLAAHAYKYESTSQVNLADFNTTIALTL